MPLLVLWLNIDFSIGAEAILNPGSCPQTPCKTAALSWSRAEPAGAASQPRAAWRGAVGAHPLGDTHTEMKLGPRNRRTHTLPSRERRRKQSKSAQEEILQYPYKPARVLSNCRNCKTHPLLQLVRRGTSRVSRQYRSLSPPKHPARPSCAAPL